MCTIPATATLDLSGRCPEAAPGPARLVFQSPQRPLLVFSFGHHSAPCWYFHSVTTAPPPGLIIGSPQRPLRSFRLVTTAPPPGLFIQSVQRPLLVFSFSHHSAPLLVFSFGHHSALSCVLKTDISYSEKGAAYMHPEFFTLHRGDEDRSSVSPTQPPYSLTLTYDSRKACLLHVLHARYRVDSHSQEKMVVGQGTQESSLAPQFESNSSFVLSLLCGLTLTSVGSSLYFHG